MSSIRLVSLCLVSTLVVVLPWLPPSVSFRSAPCLSFVLCPDPPISVMSTGPIWLFLISPCHSRNLAPTTVGVLHKQKKEEEEGRPGILNADVPPSRMNSKKRGKNRHIRCRSAPNLGTVAPSSHHSDRALICTAMDLSFCALHAELLFSFGSTPVTLIFHPVFVVQQDQVPPSRAIGDQC